MMMNRLQNQFAILDEFQMNKMRHQKPHRSHRRIRCAFPKLSDARFIPLKDQLPYAKLIPTLTEMHIKLPRQERVYPNDSNYQNNYDHTGYDSDNDTFDQVWCIEKENSTVFESDIYNEIETEDSFVF